MRGKDVVTRLQAVELGITPAYAGKSWNLMRFSEKMQDHPRLCGEKDYPHLKMPVLLGSPPPMRGKV